MLLEYLARSDSFEQLEVTSGLTMKSKSDFTASPFEVQDVQVPAVPQDVALLAGQRLSGLTTKESY
jgi:hypothetical protein